MENRIVVNNQCKAERHRTNFLLVVFVSVVIAALMWVPKAQSAEPTLKETIEYIDTKLSQCGIVETGYYLKRGNGDKSHLSLTDQYKTKTTVRLLESDEILFEADISHEMGGINHSKGIWLDNISRSYKHIGRVRLSDLTANVDIESTGFVVFRCSRKDCINVRHIGIITDGVDTTKTDAEGKNSHDGFSVCDQYQEKVKRALTHAIKISGGKEELF